MEFGGTAVESRPCLETVRALHQTVVALRAALEQSRSEILELKQRAWPVESVEEALRNLSIENHVLRTSILENDTRNKVTQAEQPGRSEEESKTTVESPVKRQESPKPSPSKKHVKIVTPIESHVTPIESPKCSSKSCENDEGRHAIEISIAIRKLKSKSLESLKTKSISKTFSFTNIAQDMSEGYPRKDSPRRISTPSDTFSPRHTSSPRHASPPRLTSSPRSNILPAHTLLTSLNVSSSPNISLTEANTAQDPVQTLENAQSEPVLQNTSQSELEQNEEVDDIELIFTTEETNDSDFKEELVPIETKNRHGPPSDFDQNLSDRELEDDVFHETEPQDAQTQLMYNSKSDNSINHEEKSLKSYYSYQDSSFENKSLEKDESFDRFEEHVRIIETDISKCGIIDLDYVSGRRNTCPNPLPYRPIIHRETLGKGLNTRKGRPILSHSSNARRESGAQTDISALPNSSWRSESSLAHKVKVGENFTTLPSKFPLPGSRLRLSEKTNVEARRVLLSDIGFTSMVPELSRSADHLCPANAKPAIPTTYGQFLRTSDLYSPGFASQKFTWTATTASPSEVSQLHSRFSSTYPLSSPLVPSRRFSAPVSPSRRVLIRPTTSKVRFANGSLPELRGDWGTTADSGDSTDSLVEEAENYLRRSIDCIVGGDIVYRNREPKTRSFRRASAPEPSGDNIPPQDWHPFLPRTPRDLHLDHWVKVIVPEGKVRGGRVRYVGVLLNQNEQYVGVQLSTPDGHSDGTYNNRRYFNCEPYHGIFVPFKKVVMGWRP